MGLSWMSALIILWSQVQVLVGPPEKQTLISNSEGFYLLRITLSNGWYVKKCVAYLCIYVQRFNPNRLGL
jgi:hypothetical protein